MNNIEQQFLTLYDIIYKQVDNVFEIFKDYYGEDRVDLQNKYTFEKFKNYILNLNLCDIVKHPIYDDTKEEINLNSTISDNINSGHLKNLDFLFANPSGINNIKNFIDEGISFPKILVYFPTVRVSNEYDDFIDIKKVFVKIGLTVHGCILGTFSIARAEYPNEQLQALYCHSHVPTLNKYSIETSIIEFKSPCLGNGPIKNTINNICIEYNQDLWELFCLELDLYIKTESVGGGPYIRLATVRASNLQQYTCSFALDNRFPNINSKDIYKSYLKEFLPYLIDSRILKFKFSNGNFSIGMTFYECLIAVSNKFIEWYNLKYKNLNYQKSYTSFLIDTFLCKCACKNNKIYINTHSCNVDTSIVQGLHLCNFKKKPIKIDITENSNLNSEGLYTIIHPEILSFLINSILKVLNFNYENQSTNRNISNRTDGKTIFL